MTCLVSGTLNTRGAKTFVSAATSQGGSQINPNKKTAIMVVLRFIVSFLSFFFAIYRLAAGNLLFCRFIYFLVSLRALLWRSERGRKVVVVVSRHTLLGIEFQFGDAALAEHGLAVCLDFDFVGDEHRGRLRISAGLSLEVFDPQAVHL